MKAILFLLCTSLWLRISLSFSRDLSKIVSSHQSTTSLHCLNENHKLSQQAYSYSSNKCEIENVEKIHQDKEPKRMIGNKSRRYFFKKSIPINLLSIGLAANLDIGTNVASASPPMKDSNEADNLTARLERARRPKPTKLLRQTLNKDFAVLLMRSSYNA